MIFCNVCGSVVMATRNQSTNGVYTRSRHIKNAHEIGLRNQHRLISVSPRKIVCSDNASVSRMAVLFLATVIPVLKKIRNWHTMLYSTRRARRPAGIWNMCHWIHILAWFYSSCIVFHRALVLDSSLQYVQCVPYAKILQIVLLFSIIWYCRYDIRWWTFRWMITFSIDYVSNMCICTDISTYIVYEIAIAKIPQNSDEFSIVRCDFMRLNSVVCP